MEHEIVLAELDKQIDLLSNDVFLTAQVPNLSFSFEPFQTSQLPVEVEEKGAEDTQIHGMDGILSALENCQLKILELEKEKSESASQIKQLKQDLNSTRQLLFFKSGNGQCNSTVNDSPKKMSCSDSSFDAVSKNQSLEKLQKLKSNWIQEARNEVEELRKKVASEKRKQSERFSKEYLFENTTNDESIDQLNLKNDLQDQSQQEQQCVKMEENILNYLQEENDGRNHRKKEDIRVNTFNSIEPPARAHVRSPSYSPVRNVEFESPTRRIDIDEDSGFLKNEQIGHLKEEILSVRKSLNQEKRPSEVRIIIKRFRN